MMGTAKNTYAEMLAGIKSRVQTARVRAGLAANRELILLYWDIGRMVAERQNAEGWSASVIDRLSVDIRRDFPDLKGFSARNIWRMKSFYLAYREQIIKLPQAVAEIGSVGKNKIPPPMVAELDKSIDYPPVLQLPWAHNVLLIEKIKDSGKLGLPTVEEIEIAEKVEEDNDAEVGMIIREWAEKYRTRTEQ